VVLDCGMKDNNKQALKMRHDIIIIVTKIIVAAQNQAISTKYFKRKIMKEEIESRCRLCKEYEETIDHLTSGCPILEKNEYLIRRDKVSVHICITQYAKH
jgi:hypothetical protein